MSMEDATTVAVLAAALNGTATGGGVGSAAAALAGELATTRFVVQRVLMPAVIVFGVLANSVNIAVLTLRVVRGSVLRDPIQPNPSSD